MRHYLPLLLLIFVIPSSSLVLFSGPALAADFQMGPVGVSELELADVLELEAEMRDPEVTLENKKNTAIFLAQKYILELRPQEAIWTLRFAGEFYRASKILLQLEDFMRTRDMFLVESSQGKNNPQLVLYKGSSLLGVINYQSKDPKTGEQGEEIFYKAFAALLDQLLSGHMVPTTVLRFWPEVQKWVSVEYYVRGLIKNSDPADQSVDFARAGYPQSQSQMWLIDFLMNYRGRSGETWSLRRGGQVVASGYEDSLRRYDDEHWRFQGKNEITLQEELIPTGTALEKLSGLKRTDFDALVTTGKEMGIDGESIVDQVFERREQISKFIKAGKSNQCNLVLGD